MISEHLFWFCLTAGCILWYSTITIYVAVKGYKDIKNMLKNLNDTNTSREKEQLTFVK
jgi:hypothetical protein